MILSCTCCNKSHILKAADLSFIPNGYDRGRDVVPLRGPACPACGGCGGGAAASGAAIDPPRITIDTSRKASGAGRIGESPNGEDRPSGGTAPSMAIVAGQRPTAGTGAPPPRRRPKEGGGPPRKPAPRRLVSEPAIQAVFIRRRSSSPRVPATRASTEPRPAGSISGTCVSKRSNWPPSTCAGVIPDV